MPRVLLNLISSPPIRPLLIFTIFAVVNTRLAWDRVAFEQKLRRSRPY